MKIRIFFIISLSILVILPYVSALPTIDFSAPTPNDGTTIFPSQFLVNLTSNGTNMTYTFLDLDRKTVAWWRMESGNGTFFNDSIDSNQITCNNITTCPNFTSSGKFGGAYLFNGNGNYLKRDAISMKLNSTPNTFSFWGFENKAETTNTFFQIGSNINCADTGNPYIDFNRVSSNSLRMFNRGAYTTSFLVSNTTWHNFIITYDGLNTSKIYVDGVNVKNHTAPQQKGNNIYLCIGRGLNGYFNGTIDEFIVFNRTLDYPEILSLYNSSQYYYYNNFSYLNITDITHTIRGYVVETSGDQEKTSLRTFIVSFSTSIISQLFPNTNNVPIIVLGSSLNFPNETILNFPYIQLNSSIIAK